MIIFNKISFPDEWLELLNSQYSELHYKISRIREHFGFTGRVSVTVFDSARDLSNYLGFTVPQWVKGTGFGDRIYLVRREGWIQDFDDSIYDIMLHELVHLAVAQRFSAQCPIWLNEGLALFYSGQHSSLDFSACSADYPYYDKDYTDEMLYCQSAQIVARLIESYGALPFVEYCRRCTEFAHDSMVGAEGLIRLNTAYSA
jgi:hypothetical protein